MPRKTVAKKRVAKKEKVKVVDVTQFNSIVNSSEKKVNFVKLGIIGLLVLVLGFLVFKNRGLFVAATVNNQPIWRINLSQKLDSRYGAQTLDEMVGEMLIFQEASAKKISVSKTDVDAKVAEIEKTLNGQISLEDALAQQGETVADFKQRVELQLLMEKLTAGQVNISEEEVTAYVEKNKAMLTATDEAGLREEAKAALTSEKQSSVLSQYFTSLKSKAKVSKYL